MQRADLVVESSRLLQQRSKIVGGVSPPRGDMPPVRTEVSQYQVTRSRIREFPSATRHLLQVITMVQILHHLSPLSPFQQLTHV